MGEFFGGSKKVWNGLDMVPDRRKQNRRRELRFQVNFDTVLQIKNVFYQCIMLDISQKGCRIKSERRIEGVHREVIVKFLVPKMLEHTFAKGKIKWIHNRENSCFVGIKFVKPIPNFDDLVG